MIRRPRFALGTNQAPTFPLTTVAGLSLAEVTPVRQRQVQATPLLHLERSAISDGTPAATTSIEMRLVMSTASFEAGLKTIDQLWDTIGTTKQHLWIIGDDTTDVLTTSNTESAGAGIVVEYTAPAKTWFAVNDYIYMPANGGSLSEIVIVTAKTDGTPSFTATLAGTHNAGATCYRVAMVYPDAVLQAIRPSAVPLGKGTLVLSWLSAGVPLYGSTFPS